MHQTIYIAQVKDASWIKYFQQNIFLSYTDHMSITQNVLIFASSHCWLLFHHNHPIIYNVTVNKPYKNFEIQRNVKKISTIHVRNEEIKNEPISMYTWSII